jgi:uncharacterized protein YdaL
VRFLYFMSNLKKVLLACLTTFTLLQSAPGQSQPTNSALIVYDSSGQYGWLGGLYARMLANLLGHFDLPYQITPVENYPAGQMDKVRTTFYFGSVYDNALPTAFKTEALTTTNTLCWFKYNVWQIAGTNFDARFGFQFNFLDWSGYSNITYKAETFLKNQLDPELGYITVLDTNLASVVATAAKTDDTSIPYATRAGNLWYFADIPFDYISEEDRYLVFADLLHDILKSNHATSHSAIIRIEDVAPTMYSPATLRETADVLRGLNVPFAIALVPVYRDPFGYYSGIPLEEHRLSDAADTNSVEFVSAIRYMLTNRAQLLLHGYTHQYDSVANPYDGVTGDDFEFWRETFQTNISDPFATNAVVEIYAPVPEDSASWVLGRINAAKAELAAVGMKEVGWEFPHYAASEIDSRVVATNFPLTMQRSLYFDDAGHIAGQFFPYPIKRDIYGQRIMPENIGNFEPLPFGAYPARSVADLLRAAKKNLVVRDGWAAGYFHPFFELTNLQAMVEGIKALGYTYVPVSSDPPAIVTQPKNTAVVLGGTATFTVSATGTAPLAYQWLFNNARLAGAINPNLVISNVQSSNVGNYRVVITNAYGAVTSSIATLTLGVAPAITNQPKSQTVLPGTNVTLTVGVTGSTPLSYRWQLEGKNLGGGAVATFTIVNVQSYDAGNYRVIVSNAFGVVTSAVAVITVAAPPVFSQQPVSHTNKAGSSVTFSCWADGTPPVRYQWKFNGKNIAGATNDWVDVLNITTANAGGYSVVASNAFGSVTSATATLTVLPPTVITSQPQNKTVKVGQPATFSVTATGVAPLTYQWRFGNVNIAGATSASYTIASCAKTNAGNYKVVVSSPGGNVTSAVAKLTVN